MRTRRFLTVTTLLCAAGLAPFASARASVVLEDTTNLMQGNQSFVDTFTVSTPGTLTISLADMAWLDPISDLQFSLTSGGQLVGPPLDAGTESFQIQPGTYSGMLFGDANGSHSLGLYNLEITFQSQTPVPLPASLLLMISSLGLLFATHKPGRYLSHRGQL